MVRTKVTKARKVRQPKETAVTLSLFDVPSLDPLRRRRDAERIVELEKERGKKLKLLLIGYTPARKFGVCRPVFGLGKYKAALAMNTAAIRVWEYDRLPTEQIVAEAPGL